MRTRRRKTTKRRRRRFYKRRGRTRRRRRRRRRMTRGGRKSTQLPVTVLCDSVDAMADAACEVVGLGPEDPLADVCAYEMATHIAKWCKRFVSKHEPSALKSILNNPMNIVKILTGKLTGKKKGSSVLSSVEVDSGHIGGVEV